MTGKRPSPGRAPSRRRRAQRTDRSDGGSDGIEISNRQSHVPIGAASIRKTVRVVLAAEQVTAARISVALTDNVTVRRVNRNYLQHDYDTDVLSFLFESTPEKAAKPKRGGADAVRPRGCGRRIDGEVLISAEMAAQTAGQFGWNPRDEVTLYLVHGLLHLCGYDDLTPVERRIMRARERAILAELGIALPNGAKRDRSARRAQTKNGSVS
jgi:probable rRNA maturation factor